MDKDRPKRIVLIVTGLALFALCLWASLGHAPAQPRAAPAVVPAAVHELPFVAWSKLQPPPLLERPRAADGTVEVEICGRGKLRVDPNDEAAAYAAIFASLEKKPMARWLENLAHSSDQRAQAAGLVLGLWGNDNEADKARLREELVKRALGSSDPAVYAMALGICSHLEGQALGRCGELDPREWAQLEPGNGAPYLLMTVAASKNNDEAGQAEAIAHLAAAKSFDNYGWRVVSLAAPALPEDLVPAERSALLSTAYALGTGIGAPTQALTRYCRNHLGQMPAQQQCAAISDLFSRHASTLLEYMYGHRLGGVIGWPQQKTALALQHRDALVAMVTGPGRMEPLEQFGCPMVAASNGYLSEVVQYGEMQVLEQRLLQSGFTEAEAAERFQQFMKSLQRKAEQEARPAD